MNNIEKFDKELERLHKNINVLVRIFGFKTEEQGLKASDEVNVNPNDQFGTKIDRLRRINDEFENISLPKKIVG